MEYERIHKPLPSQGGSFTVSPKKLRSMLLGLEKRHREVEEGEQLKMTDLELEVPQSDDRVDSQGMECSTSVSTLNNTGNRPQQHIKAALTPDDDGYDSDSFSFGFEFQKQGSTTAPSATVPVQRFTMVHSLLSPFSKPTPSKWDDAEKWISSPNSKMNGNGKMNRNAGLLVNKVVVVNGKKVDLSKVKKVGVITGGGFGLGKAKRKGLSWVDEPFGLMDLDVKNGGFGTAKPVVDSADSVNLNNISDKIHSKPTSGTILNSEVRSVSMRDMGTEMTPIASEEPSRATTPARESTPARNSTSSKTSTSPQNSASPRGVVSEVESQVKTRREIMELSEQLGKTNIAAWASSTIKEDKNQTTDQSSKIDFKNRASDWEEEQKSKYLDRFKRDEARIQDWENSEKVKIEAEMKKIEANLQKIRSRAHDKMMKKLAAAKHKADAKRAAADAKRQKEATKTAKQADFIRRTGHVPNQHFSCWRIFF